MARCPKCHRHFSTLADEANMHDCPYGCEPEPVDRTHLDGEAIHDAAGQFIGCIAPNKDGTYCADSWLDWGNLTMPNAPTREYAVQALVDHAKRGR